jgi:hypothetical protein
MAPWRTFVKIMTLLQCDSEVDFRLVILLTIGGCSAAAE